MRTRIGESRFTAPLNDPVIFTTIMGKLRSIDTEPDEDHQTIMALELGSQLSTDTSIRLSKSVKAYIFSVLSNITSVGNRQATKTMLGTLTQMVKV